MPAFSKESFFDKLKLANFYRRSGKANEALALYRECLSKGGSLSSHIRFYIALIYMNRKDYDTALSYFNGLWKSRDKLPVEIKVVLPYRIAQVYESLGDLSKAYDFYLLSLEFGTSYIRKLACYKLAFISFKRGNYKKACEWLLSILRDYPRDTRANSLLLKVFPKIRHPSKELLYRVGRAYYLRRQYNIALRYFKRSGKLFWEAMAFERMGKRREAFNLYAKLLEKGIVWEALVRRYVVLSEKVNLRRKAYFLLKSLLRRKKDKRDLILFYLYYLSHDSKYKSLLKRRYPRSAWALRASWFDGWKFYVSGKYKNALKEWRLILKYHGRSTTCAKVIYYLSRKGLYAKSRARRVLLDLFPVEYYTVRRYGISTNGKVPSLPRDALLRKLMKAGFWEFAFIRGNLLDGVSSSSRRYALSLISEKMHNYHSSVAYATSLLFMGWRSRNIWKKAYPLTNYFDYITKLSRKEKVDPLLVLSVMHQESKFNPNAVSWAGAIGLMQLMPFTAKRFGVKDRKALFSPYLNIRLGIKHLAGVMKRYRNNLYLALAAYNAGGGNVSRWVRSIRVRNWEEWMEMIPYRETRNYVRKVMATYRIYKELYKSDVLRR